MGNTPSVARNLSSSTANYFSIGNLNLEVGALYLHTTDLQILEYSAQLLSLSHTPAYLYAGTTKDVQELLNEKDQVFSEETKTNLREELENRYGSHIFLCYKQDKIITIDDCSDIVGDFKIISFQDVSRHAPVSPEKRRNVLIDCLLHFGKDYSILARYCDYISEVIGLPLSDLKYALENTRLQSAVMYIANAFDCIPAKGSFLDSVMNLEIPGEVVIPSNTGKPLFLWDNFNNFRPVISVKDSVFQLFKARPGRPFEELFVDPIKHIDILVHEKIQNIKISSKFRNQDPDFIKNSIEAIYYYTTEFHPDFNVYSTINSALSSRSVPRDCYDYVHYLVSALNALPDCDPLVTYRGLSNTAISERTDKLYSVGSKVRWIAFISVSLQKSVANLFASGGTSKGTVFEIHETRGKCVSMLSTNHGEKERILMPNSVFEVIEVRVSERNDYVIMKQYFEK